jgi:hypothetical protein
LASTLPYRRVIKFKKYSSFDAYLWDASYFDETTFT